MASSIGTHRGPGRRKLFFRDLVGPALEAKRLRGLSELAIGKDYQRLVRVAEMLKDIPARQLSAGNIERVLESLARGDRGRQALQGSTVNRYHSAVSSVLRYSARQGLIPSNPLASGAVPWSKETKCHVRFLGSDEERRFLEVVREDCPEKEAEVMLALLIGTRRSELFTAKWQDWNVEAGTLSVSGKTGPREVVINESARRCLETLLKRAPAGQLFITPEANQTAVDRRTWFEDATRKAGLRPVFHYRDLRHTFASRLAMAGVSLLTIQQLCGHASFVTTLRYAHLSPGHRREAAEKVTCAPQMVGTGVNVEDFKSPKTSLPPANTAEIKGGSS